MRSIIVLLCLTMLASCVSYSVTESEIQDYLDSRASYERTVGVKGFAHANIKFNDLKIGIGRVTDDRVNLDAKSHAKIMITGQPQQEVAIQANFSAIPYYDKSEGAIYLKDLKVESLDLTPDTFSNFAAKQLLSPIVEMVGNLILTQPVYRLDDEDMKQSLLKTARPELKIKNHALVVQML
ncbi:DUF1439 domain-containing protein [Photobacterium sp. TY1-4]|uniref:DUF1439 domain-containing protein n=1 Tax=Photobacterium sp. TY1-4 TaxID=2899122 RepID=UPI0021C01315|nr:DUF1439 domain-containing protein [Photobacterium sp. TY1-4]UXI04092.1 DUF1439 domain-containing protein [Photobacterium sp. TY1-4]